MMTTHFKCVHPCYHSCAGIPTTVGWCLLMTEEGLSLRCRSYRWDAPEPVADDVRAQWVVGKSLPILTVQHGLLQGIIAPNGRRAMEVDQKSQYLDSCTVAHRNAIPEGLTLFSASNDVGMTQLVNRRPWSRWDETITVASCNWFGLKSKSRTNLSISLSFHTIQQLWTCKTLVALPSSARLKIVNVIEIWLLVTRLFVYLYANILHKQENSCGISDSSHNATSN